MTSVWKRLQRTGKRASRFQFVASYQELILECTPKWQPDKIVIVWTRRNRRVCSKAHSWQPGIKDPFRGSVVWAVPENVDITATLYRDPHSDHFEEKEWTFQVEGEARGHKKLLAVAPIDLRKYAAINSAPRELRLTLTPRSVKVVSATLTVSITCTLLREGKATDDDMQSVASLLSLKPSDIADLDDFNEEEEEDKFQRHNRNSLGAAPREPVRELSTLAEEEDEASLSTTKKESVNPLSDDRNSHKNNESEKRLSGRSVESAARMPTVPSQDQRANEVWKIREAAPDNKPLLSDKAMEQPESAPRDGYRETRESLPKVACLEDMVSEPTVLPEDAAIKKRGHTVIITGDETEVKIPQIPSIPKRSKTGHIAEREQAKKQVAIAPEPVQVLDTEATLSNLSETVMPQRTSFSTDAFFPEKSLYAEKSPEEIPKMPEITVRSAEKDVDMTDVQESTSQSAASVTAIGDTQNTPKAQKVADAQIAYGNNGVTKDRVVVDLAAPTAPASAGDENWEKTDSNLNKISENVREMFTDHQEKEQRPFQRDGVEISANTQEAEGLKGIVRVEEQVVLETAEGVSEIGDSQETTVQRGQEATSLTEETVLLGKICETRKESEILVSEPDKVIEHIPLVDEILQDSIVAEDTSCIVDVSLQDTTLCGTVKESDITVSTPERVTENIQSVGEVLQNSICIKDTVPEDTSCTVDISLQDTTLSETVKERDIIVSTPERVTEDIQSVGEILQDSIHIKNTVPEDTVKLQDISVCEAEEQTDSGTIIKMIQKDIYSQERTDKPEFQIEVVSLNRVSKTEHTQDTSVEQPIAQQPVTITENTTPVQKHANDDVEENNLKKQDGTTEKEKRIKEPTDRCENRVSEPETVEEATVWLHEGLQDMTGTGGDRGREKDHYITHYFMQCTQKEISSDSQDGEDRIEQKIQKSDGQTVVEAEDVQTFAEETGERTTLGGVEGGAQETQTQLDLMDKTQHIIVLEQYDTAVHAKEIEQEKLDIQGEFISEENKISKTEISEEFYIDGVRCEQLQDMLEGKYQYPGDTLEVGSSKEAIDENKVRETRIPSDEGLEKETIGDEKENVQLLENTIRSEEGVNLTSKKELYLQSSGWTEAKASMVCNSSNKEECFEVEIVNLPGEEDSHKEKGEQDGLLEKCLMTDNTEPTDKNRIGKSNDLQGNTEEEYLGTGEIGKTDTDEQVLVEELEKDTIPWINNRLDIDTATNVEPINQKSEVCSTSIWTIERLEEGTDGQKDGSDKEDSSTYLLIDGSLNVEEVYFGTTKNEHTDVVKQTLHQDKEKDTTRNETMDPKDESTNTSIWAIERLEEEADKSKEEPDQEGPNTCILIDGNLNVEEVYLETTKTEPTNISEQVLDQEMKKDSYLWTNTRLDLGAATNESIDQKDEIHNSGIWTIERLEDEMDRSKRVLDQEELNTCLLIDESLNMEEVYLGGTKTGNTDINEQVLDQENVKPSCLWTNSRLDTEEGTKEEPMDQKDEVLSTGIWTIERIEEEVNTSKEMLNQKELNTCLLVDVNLNMEEVYIDAAKVENTEVLDQEKVKEPGLQTNSRFDVDDAIKKEPTDQVVEVHSTGIWTVERLEEEADRSKDVVDEDGFNSCLLIDHSLNMKEVYLGATDTEKADIDEQVLHQEKEEDSLPWTNITLEVGAANEEIQDQKCGVDNTSIQTMKRLEEKTKSVVDQEDKKTCLLIDTSLNIEPVSIKNSENQDQEEEEMWFWASEEMPTEIASTEVAMDEKYIIEREPEEHLFANNSLHEALGSTGENNKVSDKNRDVQKCEQQDSKEGEVEVRDWTEESVSLVQQAGKDVENRKEQQAPMEDAHLTTDIRINQTSTVEELIYSVQDLPSKGFKKVEWRDSMEEPIEISENKAELSLGMTEEGIALEEVSGDGTMCFQDSISPSASIVIQHKVQEITNTKCIIQENEQTSSLRLGKVDLDIKGTEKKENLEDSTAVSEEWTFMEAASQETHHGRIEKPLEIPAISDCIPESTPHITTITQQNDFPQDIVVEEHKEPEPGDHDIENMLQTAMEQNDQPSRTDIEFFIQEFHIPVIPSEAGQSYSLGDSSSGAEKNTAHMLSESTFSVHPPQTFGQQRSKEKKRLSESTGQIGEVCDSL